MNKEIIIKKEHIVINMIIIIVFDNSFSNGL